MNLTKISKRKIRKVPVETKKAIIDAITHRKLKYREVAKIFDVKYDTVKGINNKYKKLGNIEERVCGGARKSKITEETINILKSEITANNPLTRLKLKHKLKETHQLDISLNTLSRYIKKIKFTNDCKLFARVKYEKYQNQFQIQDKIISYYAGLSTKFDEIFSMTDRNDDIFQSMKPILESFYNGYDGSIILLGSSRSGNMYTMYGSESENGLFALIINYIYNGLVEKCRKEIIMRVSYMEITKDKISDLLNPRNEKVSIVFNPSTKQSKFTNLHRYLCQSEELALQVKEAGFLRRGSKSMRSHFVFRFSMEIVDYQNSDGISTKSTISHLDIVDMLPDESPEFFDFIHKAANGESPAIEDATDCLLPVLCKPLLGQCQSIYLFHIQMSDVSETRRILEDSSALRLLKHEVPVRKDHVLLDEDSLSGLSHQLTDLVSLISRPSDFGIASAATGNHKMIQALEKSLLALRDESAGEIICSRFNEIFVYCRLLKERLLFSSSRLTEVEHAVTSLQKTFQSTIPKPRTKTFSSSVPKSNTEPVLYSVPEPCTETVISAVPELITETVLTSVLKPHTRTVQSSVTNPSSRTVQSSITNPGSKTVQSSVPEPPRSKTILCSVPKPRTLMVMPGMPNPGYSVFKSTWVPSNTTTVVSNSSSLHYTNNNTLISKNPKITTPIATTATNVNPKYLTPIPVIKLLPEIPKVNVDSKSLKSEEQAICTPPTNRVQAKPPPYCIRVVRVNSSTDK